MITCGIFFKHILPCFHPIINFFVIFIHKYPHLLLHIRPFQYVSNLLHDIIKYVFPFVVMVSMLSLKSIIYKVALCSFFFALIKITTSKFAQFGCLGFIVLISMELASQEPYVLHSFVLTKLRIVHIITTVHNV